MIDPEGTSNIIQIQQTMIDRGLWLAAAESCTGGLLGSLITDQSGSSQYFLGGVISYSNEIKTRFLGVRQNTLDQHGAVSKQTALEMAVGIRHLFASTDHPIERIIGLSITGIAGPRGGTPQKPVGLVWIGIDGSDGHVCHNHQVHISRLENKNTFAQLALLHLYDYLLDQQHSR